VKGMLTPPELVAETRRPSFMAFTPMRSGKPRFMYAVNAVPDASATVTSFAVDGRTGGLKEIGRVTSAGAGPCYVSVDDTGSSAFVANYVGSSLASYRIQADGTLSQPVERLNCKDVGSFGGVGPNSVRQDASHPHSATISPDNRFLLVNDLGTDHISVFAIDPATAKLADHQLFTNNRTGSGPRHVAFHPNGRWVYGICEIDSVIDRYLWTATQYSKTPEGLLVNMPADTSTIAPGFPKEKNTAAEMAISSDGRFLYASNRGEDTLVVFAIGQKGELNLVQRISCGGKTPRHFTLSPTTEWVLCGNQDSATVTVFRRDATTGKLNGPVQTVPLDSVMYTLFA
jgi:6-phosphogluconolactonase